jgi:hypothetical protein
VYVLTLTRARAAELLARPPVRDFSEDPLDVLRYAVHEGGHLVAHVPLYGVPVLVTIRPDAIAGGRLQVAATPQPIRPPAEAAAAFASSTPSPAAVRAELAQLLPGLAAEAILTGDVAFPTHRAEARTARALIAATTPAAERERVLADAWRDALDFAGHPASWAGIAAVAAALVEAWTLSGAEAWKLATRAMREAAATHPYRRP